MKLLVIFIILNVVNVIIQTIKSIATVKGGKVVASVVNAIAYGLYTVVVVYMVCELPLWVKVLVVAVANLIGVFVVKLLEEKTRKDKMWKVEMAIDKKYTSSAHAILTEKGIPHNYIVVGSNIMFNCYCDKQEDTRIVKKLAKEFNGKISAYKSENLF